MFVGACVLLVGYGTWATQSDVAPAGPKARVKFADAEIRISSDTVQASGNTIRYTGNVILEIARHEGSVQVGANKISYLDVSFKGDVRLEGSVQIEVDGRIFTTEHALMSEKAFQNAFLMDEVEVLQKVSGETTSARGRQPFAAYEGAIPRKDNCQRSGKDPLHRDMKSERRG
jgi:lipopolysaccharide assembly outer membrane protein LptD (OstA)